MRLPLILWFALCGWAMGLRLVNDLTVAPAVDVVLILDAIARISGIAFVLLVILALVMRGPAVARATGIMPRLAAFGGTFSITLLALLTPIRPSLIGATASLILMSAGYFFACYAILHLGRSLSMMAEARKLVTTGPYRFVRHPLYVAEAVASAGLLLQYLSAPAVLLWLAHIALQLARMNYEEAVLAQSFPDYADYSRRVPRVIPGIY